MLRQVPAELLGALEEQRLTTLRVVRAQVEVHEAPAGLVGKARAEAIDLVVRPVDADHGRAVRGGARDLALVGARGDEHEPAKTVARRRGRDGAREVAGRRAGDRVEPELERAREGQRDRSVLERERWIARVVLHVELGDADLGAQARRLDERRPADGEVRLRRGDREERRVAPERARSVLDRPAQPVGVERGGVVLGLDRAVAVGADVPLVGRLEEMARAAAQAHERGRPCRRRHRHLAYLLPEMERPPFREALLVVLARVCGAGLASRTRLEPRDRGDRHRRDRHERHFSPR